MVDLRRLSGGASRETWSFDLRTADGVDALILRKDPAGAPKGTMALEARLLRAAGAAGVPVPEVRAAGDDFLVMSRIEGETIPRRILRDEAFRSARAGLARECGVLLARLHQISVEDVGGLEQVDQVTQFRGLLDSLGQPHPVLELAFRWLDANRRAPGPPAIVHGDFRNGNLVVGPDGVRAVLDWELAHAGDPAEDLGWLCVKAWRFGVDLPVGGFGTYEDLLSGYAGAGGRTVDLDVLRWWEVLGTVKWGVMCIMQAMTHVSGAVRSVELAAIGRRVAEVEWDVIGLLGPGQQ